MAANERAPLLDGNRPLRSFLSSLRSVFAGDAETGASEARPFLADTGPQVSSPVVDAGAGYPEYPSAEPVPSKERPPRTWPWCLLALVVVGSAVLAVWFLAIPRFIESLIAGNTGGADIGRVELVAFDDAGVTVAVQDLSLKTGRALPFAAFMDEARFEVLSCGLPNASSGAADDGAPACSDRADLTHLYKLDTPRFVVPGSTEDLLLSFPVRVEDLNTNLGGQIQRILALKDAAPPMSSLARGRPSVGIQLLGIPFRWRVAIEQAMSFDVAELFRNVSKYELSYQLLAHNGSSGALPFPSEESLEFNASMEFRNPYPFSLRDQPFAVELQVFTNDSKKDTFPGHRLASVTMYHLGLDRGQNQRNISILTNPEEHDRLLSLVAKAVLHIPVSVALRQVRLVGENVVPWWMQRIAGTIDMVIDLHN